MSATVQDFELVRIQTCVLKVQINCHGCLQKVKKLLKRIEGVYQVKMDVDEQVVIISGNVDSATLIKKLNKSGKHAELLSENPMENQETELLYNWLNDDFHQNQGGLSWCDDEKTQNRELLDWLNNTKHQNQMHSLYNSLGASKRRPMCAPTERGFDHWGNKQFLDQSIGNDSLSGEANRNLFALGNMDYPYNVQEESIINNADFGRTSAFGYLQSLQGRRNSMVDFQGLRDSNPSFYPNQGLRSINSCFANLGSEEPGLQNLHTAQGEYGYQPRPFSEMNDMQAFHYKHPSSTMNSFFDYPPTMMNSYRQNSHDNGIGNIINDIYTYQPGRILNQTPYGVFPPNISHSWNMNNYNN
uniref:Chloroplast-targeted copper chaperone n=2 Tax=Solanum tuberosum TaxID=4113 RepID=M1D0G9_SOLTU